MAELLHDSSFWVLIAFVLFIILLITKASSMVSNTLEGRATIIKNKIQEPADALKEAQKLLKKSQDALKRYKNETKNIIAKERQKALAKTRERIEKIEIDIQKKEKSLDEEIKYLQQSIKSSIQKQIVDIAINSAQSLIINSNKVEASDKIFKFFLKKVPYTVLDKN